MTDQSIRALHVIPSLSVKQGGPSYAVRTMARALAMVDVDVTIATTDDDGNDSRLKVPIAEPIKEEAATIYYFGRNILPYKVSLGLSRWLKLNIARFDVVHIHALFSFSSTTAARAARRHGVPYIIRPLGVLNRWGLENRRAFLKQVSLRLVEIPMMCDAAAIHYTSEAERLEASKVSDRIAARKSVVIPLPVEIADGNAGDFLRRFPQVAGRRVILFLSRIDKKKGIELLLDAFAVIRKQQPNAFLVVAGDGDTRYVDQLRTQTCQLRIGDYVLWTGFLGPVEKANAYAAASIFVLPSYSENFGIAAAEALRAGIPCVLTDQVALSDYLENNQSAIIVPCQSSALADAIRELLSSDEKRLSLAKCGLLVANERFSLQTVGKELLNLYESVLT